MLTISIIFALLLLLWSRIGVTHADGHSNRYAVLAVRVRGAAASFIRNQGLRRRGTLHQSTA